MIASLTGRKLSEETRSKMSASRKGRPGHKHSEEVKAQMSASRTGRKHSEETKAKMSACRKGRRHTEETKQKLSIAKKGKPNGCLGRPRTEETKRKISLAHKGKSTGPFSPERRAEMSAARKGIAPSNLDALHKLQVGRPRPDTVIRNLVTSKGITAISKRVRGYAKYAQWRTSIFQKDDYTCQQCGKRGGRLQADHYPETFSSLLRRHNITNYDDAMKCDELWEIGENRTLCVACHLKTPTHAMRGKKAQMEIIERKATQALRGL